MDLNLARTGMAAASRRAHHARRSVTFTFAFAFGLPGILLAGCTAGPLDVGGVKPTTLRNGLIAHWPLDEGGGTMVNDRSGNNHNGTLIGGAWVPGQFGSAVHFTGAAHDEIAVRDFPQGMLDWSVALWVRLPVGDFPLPYVTLISTENVSASGVDGGWQMNARLAATEAFYQFAYWKGRGPSDYVSYDCHCVDRESWIHIAGVVDSQAGTLSFYRDGAPYSQSNATEQIKPGSPTLYMGRWQSAERWLTGALDDVVIYNRALLPEEVRELSLAPAPDPL